MTERHLAQLGHFTLAHLMDDLAGLGVGHGVGGFRLLRREMAEHAAGDRRIEPQHLQRRDQGRSEEHTSELQSLMRISYAVFCLKKKTSTTILQCTHYLVNSNNKCSN